MSTTVEIFDRRDFQPSGFLVVGILTIGILNGFHVRNTANARHRWPFDVTSGEFD